MIGPPLATLPEVSSGSRSLRLALLFLAAGGVSAVVPFTEYAALYAIVVALGIACVLPASYDWLHDRLDFFAPGHAIALAFFVYFGLGSIWTVNNPEFVAYDIHLVPYIPRAALYALLGFLAFLLGYLAFFRSTSKLPPRVEALNGSAFMMGIGGLGMLGMFCHSAVESAAHQFRSIAAVFSSLAQFSPLFLFSWALAWIVFFSGRATRGQKWTLFGGLLPGVLMTGYLTFSDKSMALTLVLVPLAARWYAKRKMAWSFLIVTLLVLVFVIFPLYNTFRWFDEGLDRGERVGLAVQTIQGWESERFMRFSVQAFFARLAMVNSLAVVMRESPNWVPHMYGKTIFMPMVTYFVPRVLWPEKPTMTFGRDFGREFRVTNFWSRKTFIGPTIPGELYWNFGLPGILVGMAILGWIIRFLYEHYGGRSAGAAPLLAATNIVLLIQWIHIIGGTVAHGLVGVGRLLIVLAVLRWVGRYVGLLEYRERA